MTRLRLKFVQAWVDREGRAHHYFRRAGYARVPLPGFPGSPEFNRAYEAALGSAPEPIGAARIKPGSVAAAIASYRGSGAFKDLSMETQQMRGAVLDAFKREHGDKMIRHMPRKFLVALFAGMGVTTAKNWRTAIRALCQHAVEADMLDEDPTLGIRLRAKKGEGSEGIHTWDEDEIGRFEAVHPIGSRERLAFTLGLSTAQRRGDVMRMGRQHIRQDPQDPNGEVLYVRQKKTGKPLLLPIYPELRAVLDLIPATQMTFLTTARGKPFHRGTSFTQWFRKACDKAGLPAACTFHGLRKAAARRDAEAGCSEKEIAAHTGLASLREVERYTKAADQLRLVRAAMARTAAAREQSGTETVKPGRVRVSNPLSPLRKKPA